MAAIIKANFIVNFKIMTLAGHHHVIIAVQHQTRRTPGLMAGQRGHGGNQGGLGFLATKAAAHAPQLNAHIMAVPVQHMRDQVLHFTGMLG